MTAVDFYKAFDANKEVFNASSTYDEFCQSMNTPLWSHLATYVWVSAVFRTAKAGKRTARALVYPEASKFTDIFAEAVLCKDRDVPMGCTYFGGTGSVHGHFGGKRDRSPTSPDIHRHTGCAWYSTYVKASFNHRFSSFTDFRRDDGILIEAKYSDGIESTWIALLDPTETINSMFDASTLEFLAKEKAEAIAAWGEE